ncbi:MAG: hypothetical protein IRY99_15415, partial [Isosphaeraceae bacterium]|nr:hypothetical protein [Isosphaeraceae bacterium]
KSAADFLPSFTLSVWAYTDFTDPRWHFGHQTITLRQNPQRGPTKLGISNTRGAVGYLNHGTLFIKRFGYDPTKPYPDNGCNFETFTNEDMLEVESLGPLVRLAPGAAVEHTEHWELHAGLGDVKGEPEIDAKILPLLLK